MSWTANRFYLSIKSQQPHVNSPDRDQPLASYAHDERVVENSRKYSCAKRKAVVWRSEVDAKPDQKSRTLYWEYGVFAKNWDTFKAVDETDDRLPEYDSVVPLKAEFFAAMMTELQRPLGVAEREVLWTAFEKTTETSSRVVMRRWKTGYLIHPTNLLNTFWRAW